MTQALVVLFGPLAAFALIGLLPPLRRSGRPAAIVSIAGIGASFVAAIAQVVPFASVSEAAPRVYDFVWAPLATVPSIRFGLLIDGLSASMAVLVAGIALAVQIYSLAYMAGEKPPQSNLAQAISRALSKEPGKY